MNGFGLPCHLGNRYLFAMKSRRCLWAVFLGAVVVFVWLNVSWMVLQWHGIKSVEEEASTAAALKAAASEAGVYALPAWKDADGEMLDPDAMANAIEAGPFAFLVVHPDGLQVSMARSMGTGFGINLLGAALLCYLMLMVGEGGVNDFKRRVVVAVIFGLAVGILPALSNWNWWHFPMSYTLATTADALISWTLAGLVMAKVLTSKPVLIA